MYQKIADVMLKVDDRPVRLSSLYRDRPVILAQVFATCSGVCAPSLLTLRDHLEQLGDDLPYTVLVVSFDPRDTSADLLRFAARLSVDHQPHWIFATTQQIDLLTASAGFTATWDPARRQYDHDALLTGVNRQGIIKKKLLGLREASAIGQMLREINDQFTAAYALPSANTLFSCFSYNAATGKNHVGSGFLVMLVPALATLVLIGLLGWRAGHSA